MKKQRKRIELRIERVRVISDLTPVEGGCGIKIWTQTEGNNNSNRTCNTKLTQ